MSNYEFGNRLYELRRSKRLSQTELGQLVGVSNKAVSKWETGAAFPKTETLCELAVVFGITVEELLQQKSAEPLTLESLSYVSKGYILEDKQQKNSRENSELRQRKNYIIMIAVIFILTILIEVGLIINGGFEVVITDSDSSNIMDSVLPYFLWPLLTFHFLSGAASGFYLMILCIRKFPSYFQIILCILFLFASVIAVFIGTTVWIPYFVYNIIKLKRSKRNGKLQADNK